MSSIPNSIAGGAVAAGASALPIPDFRAHGAHGRHGSATSGTSQTSRPASVTDLIAGALGDGVGSLPAGAGAALLTAGATAGGATGAPVSPSAKRGGLLDVQA